MSSSWRSGPNVTRALVHLSFRALAGTAVAVVAAALWAGSPASAQPHDGSLRLVVDEGTPLRVALDRRVIVRRVGQQVEAVLVDPVFAWDRIVIPAGTRVLGHVEQDRKSTRLNSSHLGNSYA